MTAQADLDLFGPAAPSLPDGMRYEPGFLTADEEQALIARIAGLPLAPMQYKGYSALRRVLSYGGSYDFSAGRLEAREAPPPWLDALKARVADWLATTPDAFTQVLVAEYRPGTPLGWHRDVPDFEDIVGVSLLGEAAMRLRPWPHVVGRRGADLRLTVAPRSIYLLRGPARWAWQHSVMPTPALRYSVTLRTPRRRRRLSAAAR